MISSHVEIYAVKCAESMIGRLGRVKGKGARSDWLSKRGRLSCRGQDVIEDTAVESRLTYASPLQSWVEETERKMLTHTLTNSIDIAYPSMRSDGFCIWYHNWFSYTRAVSLSRLRWFGNGCRSVILAIACSRNVSVRLHKASSRSEHTSFSR